MISDRKPVRVTDTRACAKCGLVFCAVRCPECKKVIDARHRLKHADKKRLAAAAWAAANPERRKAYAKVYQVEQAAAISVTKRKNYLANKERILAKDKLYREANKEKVAARRKRWLLKNPDVIRINKQNRRERAKSAGGQLSKGLTEKLFQAQRGKCACCKLDLGDNYELDHVLPLALGGLNEDANMQLLRKACNRQKHAKHPVDFMQSRGYLL